MRNDSLETVIPRQPKVLVVNGKMYSVCADCESIVCLNKFILGSLHICLTDEEIKAKNKCFRP